MQPNTPRFTKIGGDGSVLPATATAWEAVLDNTTGLMWSLETKKVQSWRIADAAARTIKAAGFDDWHLPAIEQLFMLADRTRHSPAIDTAFFPGTANDWHFSSTPYASLPGDFRWFVVFADGNAGWGGEDDDGFVRAVRVSQSSED